MMDANTEHGYRCIVRTHVYRSVGKSDDTKETKTAKEKQTKRQVSAIKTILLVSGTYFLLYFPFLSMRLVLYSTISAIDLETRRYPAVTLFVRSATLLMSTTTPLLNPILYLNTRKNLKSSLIAFLPWLRLIRRIRIRRINVAESASFSAGL
jgi:hypothetical protein